MLKVIPFHRKHLDLLEARAYERDKVIPYLNSDYLSVLEQTPYCYTVTAAGLIITCMGVCQLWGGVGEIWQLPSVYVEQHKKEYCKLIRVKLSEVAEALGLWRMQTSAPADDLHRRWMTFLGFNHEGVMLKYSRFKIDYDMWAKGFKNEC